ncbi:MAG TPA: hypothetical protein VJC18_12090, partial [bacterium]|nr:hypothetical protein [bacterium]
MARWANAQKLDFLVLTDHDSIQGSLALKKHCNENHLNIEVPLSAEYQTEYGDVIAMGIHKEIESRKYAAFVREVREQGGLLLLPHPYVGHKNINQLAEDVDMIEVFNARCRNVDNIRAMDLAKKHGKGMCYAGDAHSLNELENCIVVLNQHGEFLSAVKTGGMV